MATKKTTTLIRLALLIGTLVSLYFVPWPILMANITPLPNTVQKQVDKAADYGFDGIIVAVNKQDTTTELYTSGYHNREAKTPAKPNALFKIASVGKLYNAVALAKLVASNTLDLNQTLAYYLPELKDRIAYANEITLQMLVSHRSGIPNYTDTYMYWAAPKETAAENLALVLDKPANFKPNEAYEYCNTNYLLLDKIITKVLGYQTFQYIQETILTPLNLTHTYGSLEAVPLENVMSGYYVGHPTDLKTDPIGSMLATAEDVSIFIRALNNGSVFSNNKEQEIYSAIYKYEHTGLIPGYQTIAKYHKDIDAVVIQFTNTVDFEGYNWSMSEIMYDRIVAILKKEKEQN